jgi:hypothetical protein
VAQLTRLPIPIVAPTDIPAGFRVVKAEGDSVKYTNGDDDAGYNILYRRDDNTCFAIRSSKDGPRGLTPLGKVETTVGAVTMYESVFNNRRSTLSFIPVKGNPMMISPESLQNARTGEYEACKPLDSATYKQVLQSLAIVQ